MNHEKPIQSFLIPVMKKKKRVMIPEIKKKRMMITDMKNEKGVKIKPVEQLIEQDDLHTV